MAKDSEFGNRLLADLESIFGKGLIAEEADSEIQDAMKDIGKISTIRYVPLWLPEGVKIYAPEATVEKLRGRFGQVGISEMNEPGIDIPEFGKVKEIIDDTATYVAKVVPPALIEPADFYVRNSMKASLNPDLSKPLISGLGLTTLVNSYTAPGPV